MRTFSCPYECVDDTAEKRHLEKEYQKKNDRGERNEKKMKI